MYILERTTKACLACKCANTEADLIEMLDDISKAFSTYITQKPSVHTSTEHFLRDVKPLIYGSSDSTFTINNHPLTRLSRIPSSGRCLGNKMNPWRF